MHPLIRRARASVLRTAMLALACSIPAAPALAAPGGLDPGFGQRGRLLTDFGNSTDIANAVAVQPDGKLVVAGTSYTNNDFSGEDFALARYNPDGSLDAGFGTNGRVTTDFPGLAAVVSAVVVQPDGKILVAGGAFPELSFAGNFALARYNPDGSLDTGFGSGGLVTTNFPDGSFANAIALQPDGRIVAAGTDFVDFSSGASSNTDIALARYNPDGSPDASFGDGGQVTTDFHRLNDDAFAVLVQPDGRILAVGSSRSNLTDYDFAAVRYLGDGELDTSFGVGGKVQADFGNGGFDRARAAVLQPDGRIVAAGFATVSGSQTFAVARWRSNGALDRSFSGGGMRQVPTGNCCESANALLLQGDGRLVLVGYPVGSEGANADFTLARLTPNGSLDVSFGTGGRVRTSFGDLNGGANGAALQSDGKIVAVGFQATSTPKGTQFALARYLGQ